MGTLPLKTGNILNLSAAELVQRFGTPTRVLEELEIAAAEQGLYEDCGDKDPLETNEAYLDLVEMQENQQLS